MQLKVFKEKEGKFLETINNLKSNALEKKKTQVDKEIKENDIIL